MGLGVTGSAPLVVWQEAMNSELSAHGDAPQLAVGQLMFGKIGYLLMALSSVAATLGSLVVAFAAMPRLIYSIARDGKFFGPLSKPFGKLHPRFGTPVAATVFTFLLYIIPGFYSSAVIDWVYSAAYAWIILYIIFHILAFVNRKINFSVNKAFRKAWFVPMTLVGIAATVIGLYYAFAGAHLEFGLRALVVLLGALIVTSISFILPSDRQKAPPQSIFNITESEVANELMAQPLFTEEKQYEKV